MDEQLQLTLTAIDKLAALDKMLDTLGSIDKSLVDLNSKFVKLQDSLKTLNKTAPLDKFKGGLKEAIFAMDGAAVKANLTASAIKFAFSSVGTVINAAFSGLVTGTKSFVGAVIEGQKFKQDTKVQFKALFGSDYEADKQYNNLFAITGQTPGTVEGLRAATKSFKAAGYSNDELATLQAYYSDQQALNGEEGGRNYAALITKIAGQGKLTGESLQMAGAESLGVGKIRAQIGVELGLKGSKQSIQDQVTKLVSAGKITMPLAVKAINAVSLNQTGGGTAGQFAVKAGTESISGALSNVEEGFQNLFRRLELKNMPALAEFLGNITKALNDPAVIESFRKAADSLFEPLKKISSQDVISAMQTVAGLVKDIANGLSTTFNILAKLGKIPKAIHAFGDRIDDALQPSTSEGHGPNFIAAIPSTPGPIDPYARDKEGNLLPSNSRNMGMLGKVQGLSAYTSAQTANAITVNNNIVVNGNVDDTNELKDAATTGTKKGLAGASANKSALDAKRSRGR